MLDPNRRRNSPYSTYFYAALVLLLCISLTRLLLFLYVSVFYCIRPPALEPFQYNWMLITVAHSFRTNKSLFEADMAVENEPGIMSNSLDWVFTYQNNDNVHNIRSALRDTPFDFFNCVWVGSVYNLPVELNQQRWLIVHSINTWEWLLVCVTGLFYYTYGHGHSCSNSSSDRRWRPLRRLCIFYSVVGLPTHQFCGVALTVKKSFCAGAKKFVFPLINEG